MKKWWMGISLLLIVVLLAACGSKSNAPASGNTSTSSGDKPIELTYAFFAPSTTFPAKQMEKWKEEVEKRTNGKVTVKLFPGGTLLTDKNMYDGVKSGVADIGLSVMTYEPGRFPLMTIAEMPSGFPNAKVASQVVYDLMQEYPQDAFKDMKLITAFATEPAYLQTKDPISTLSDLKGKQIRISGALAPVLKGVGASPVGMSQSEAVEALQTGVISGYVSSREVLKDLKFAEMVKYETNYPLTVSTFAAVMNKDKWDSLPPDVQKVINDLGPEIAAWAGEFLDTSVKGAMEWAQTEQGFKVIELSPEEKKVWDEKLKPFQDKTVSDLQAKGLPAEEFRKRVYELKDQYSK